MYPILPPTPSSRPGGDFVIVALLRRRDYDGWITLDLDPTRPDEGTIEENLDLNRRNLTEELKLELS
ncbi:MAG: hypothetical protein ACK5AZ_24170 [Bryobacteraceae bacterium]